MKENKIIELKKIIIDEIKYINSIKILEYVYFTIKGIKKAVRLLFLLFFKKKINHFISYFFILFV